MSTVDIKNVPLDRKAVARIVHDSEIDLRVASIREMNRIVNEIETELEIDFIRMEFGVPGLPTPDIAIDAEVEALRTKRLANRYAPFDGVPELKREAALFAKNFMNIDVSPACCVPTVGAMQGGFLAQAVAGRMDPKKKTILFLHPSFPVNRQQTRFLGFKEAHIDFYDHRGDKLIEALDKRLAEGDVAAVIWSSPNNPSWIILTDDELAGMGRVLDKHSVIGIEDLAYFGMDFRKHYGVPGEPPYQPTIARHCRRWFVLFSASKAFSYAGQRIGVAYIAPDLMEEESEYLEPFFATKKVGYAFLHGGIYPTTASVPEGPQHGLLALMQAANEGHLDFTDLTREYGRRAEVMKRMFLENGFEIVYKDDLGEPLADGFYFTFSYPGFDQGFELIAEMLHYGISAITLDSAGSCRKEAVRGCVSLVHPSRFDDLQYRLRQFNQDHPRD